MLCSTMKYGIHVLSNDSLVDSVCLNVSTHSMLVKFSADNTFLIFPRKQALRFLANCLLRQLHEVSKPIF